MDMIERPWIVHAAKEDSLKIEKAFEGERIRILGDNVWGVLVSDRKTMVIFYLSMTPKVYRRLWESFKPYGIVCGKGTIPKEAGIKIQSYNVETTIEFLKREVG